MIVSEVQGDIGVATYKDSICERIGVVMHASSGGISFDKCGKLSAWHQHSKVDSLRKRRVLIKNLAKATY